MKFNEIAALSGKGGLFKVISPTRTGIILETLDGSRKRMIVGPSVKVSILSEISIYLSKEVESVPLYEVFKIIHKNYAGEIGLDKKSDHNELKSFFKSVLPDYDLDRVYVSDIKKVITWYQSLLNLGLANLIEEDHPEVKKSKSAKAEVDGVVQKSSVKKKNKKDNNSLKK